MAREEECVRLPGVGCCPSGWAWGLCSLAVGHLGAHRMGQENQAPALDSSQLLDL